MAGMLDALRALFSPPPFVQSSDPFGFGMLPDDRRSLSFETLWGTGQDFGGTNTIAGVAVSTDTALNASAVWACVRLISGAISGLPLHAFRDTGDARVPIRLPDWLERPIPNNPNITRNVHVQSVVTSMLLDGNAFIRFLPDAAHPIAMTVLSPSDVDVRTDPDHNVSYIIRSTRTELTPAEVVHIPYMVVPGKARGLNPVDAARQTIGLTLAADQYAAAFFGNGATLSGTIEFPVGVEPDENQLREMKESFKRRHVGSSKSYAVGALTGGAKWVPSESNNRDSQLNELREYQVEDVGRLYGVPPHMIGSQKPGAVAYASVEQRNIDFVTHGLQPVIEKLEDGYERVLRGQRTFFKFNVDGLLRGDVKSRWDAYGVALDKKVMRREEVRAKEDLPNIGELGFLETPNNNPKEEAPARALLEDGAIRVDVQPSIFTEPVNLEQMPTVEVRAPDVHVDNAAVAAAVLELAESIRNRPDPPTVIESTFIRDTAGKPTDIVRHMSDGSTVRYRVDRDGKSLALVKSA